jgi:hypothetical protein
VESWRWSEPVWRRDVILSMIRMALGGAWVGERGGGVGTGTEGLMAHVP